MHFGVTAPSSFHRNSIDVHRHQCDFMLNVKCHSKLQLIQSDKRDKLMKPATLLLLLTLPTPKGWNGE